MQRGEGNSEQPGQGSSEEAALLDNSIIDWLVLSLKGWPASGSTFTLVEGLMGWGRQIRVFFVALTVFVEYRVSQNSLSPRL